MTIQRRKHEGVIYFIILCILVLLVMGNTPVQAVNLDGKSLTITGVEKLKIRRCCKDKDIVVLNVNFGDGVWDANDEEGHFYSGTYRTISRNGRKFLFQLDLGSLATLTDALEEWAEELAEDSVTITDLDYSFKMKVNRKLTKAKLKGKVKLTGHTTERSGKGVYKIKGKGLF